MPSIFAAAGIDLAARHPHDDLQLLAVWRARFDARHEDKASFQPDQRAWPKRHPWALHRLRMAERVATKFDDPAPTFRPRPKISRKSMPQAPKAHFERMPRFTLKPMPFKTFGELPTMGLKLQVHCPTCHREKPVEIGDRLAPMRWGKVRFTCDSTHWSGRKCASWGHLYLHPAGTLDPEVKFVSLECARCLPPWFAEDVQLERPPWSLAPIDAGTERYACPAAAAGSAPPFMGCPAIAGVDGE